MMTESILYKKLALVLGKIKRVTEMGKSSQGYNFATDEAIYDMAREALASEGLAILAHLKSVEDIGEKRIRSTFAFTIVCGESGETAESTWAADAWSNDDKSINKTATVAMKYWLKTTLLIGTGKPEDDTDFGDQSQQEKRTQLKQTKTPPPARENPNFVQSPALNGGLSYEDGKEIVRIAKNVYGLTDSHQVCEILNVTKLSDFKQSKEAALKILKAAYSTVMGANEPLKGDNSKTEPPTGGESIQPALVSAPEPPTDPDPTEPYGSFRKPKTNGDTAPRIVLGTERTPADVFAELHDLRDKSKLSPKTLKELIKESGVQHGKAIALARYFMKRGWNDEHRHFFYDRAWGKSHGDELTEQEFDATKGWLLSETHPGDPEMMLEWAKGELQAAPASEAAEAK